MTLRFAVCRKCRYGVFSAHAADTNGCRVKEWNAPQPVQSANRLTGIVHAGAKSLPKNELNPNSGRLTNSTIKPSSSSC